MTAVALLLGLGCQETSSEPAHFSGPTGCPAGTEGCPCTPTLACADGLSCVDGQCGPAPRCGDGVVQPPEQCDDGNFIAKDGCETDCVPTTGVEQLAAGARHTCALLWNGRVRCWGWGRDGQLGHGERESIGDDETPAWRGDVPLPERAIQIAAGSFHTCALMRGGAVHCWGRDEFGQLGRGRRPSGCRSEGVFSCQAGPGCCVGDDESLASEEPVELAGSARAVFAGGSTSCAVLEGGKVQCWGANQFGQLGMEVGPCRGAACIDGPTCCIGDDEVPAEIPPVDMGPIETMAASRVATCALDEHGAIRCWGLPLPLDRDLIPVCTEWLFGEQAYFCDAAPQCCIGDDEPVSGVLPVDLGDPVTVLDLHTEPSFNQELSRRCLATMTGSVYCTDGTVVHAEQVLVGELGGRVDDLFVVRDRSCVQLAGGVVRCWGRNDRGQLGYGHTKPLDGPEDAASVEVGGRVVQLVGGWMHTCVRLADDSVRCWGSAGAETGYGLEEPIGDDETPARVGEVAIE